MNTFLNPEQRAGPTRLLAGMETLRSPAASLRKFRRFCAAHVVSGLSAISRIPSASERNAAFWLYLKFVSRLFTAPFLPTGRISKEKVVGAELAVLDYGTFLTLLSEIFFRRIYYFESESPSPLILDAGSNIGMSILFFKHLYPRCRVVGFEPDPQTFEVLKSNIRQNRWDHVEVFNKALHSTDGEIAFYTEANRAGSGKMSTVRERFGNSPARFLRCQTVEAVQLSRFIVEEIDLLKMDIEGSERAVMKELSDANKLRFIKQIVLEYHHHLNPSEDRLSEVLRILEENGFGYQISSGATAPLAPYTIQPILIYAYRRR